LLTNGYELLQGDEALFSVDAFQQRHWAPMKQPMCKTSRWSDHKPVVVFGVISASRGVVHWHFGHHSFTADDICDAVREIRAKIGDGVPIALSLDNAKVH